MGEGLFVYKAVQNRDNGMSIEDNVKWLEDNKLHFCHQFTVDDLHHLHRGGRVSKAAAINLWPSVFSPRIAANRLPATAVLESMDAPVIYCVSSPCTRLPPEASVICLRFSLFISIFPLKTPLVF